MSRTLSPDAASERTPLIRNEIPTSTSAKQQNRRPSVIALTVLSIAVLAALALGFAAPAVVEAYGKDAAVFEPETLSIDSFTDTGIRARVKGAAYLDAAKVKSKPVRDLGRAATWIARKVKTGNAKVRVYLPEYDNILLGTALLPPIVMDIRNTHVNYIDLIVDVEPGQSEGFGRVVQDFINGRSHELHVDAIAKIPVSSGLISFGTQTVSKSLQFKSGIAKIPKIEIEDLKVSEFGPPGHPEGVSATAKVSALNPYPIDLDVPPVAMELLLLGCSGEHLTLGTAKTDVVHISPKQLVSASVSGLARKLPTSLTTACPQSNKSPLDVFVGAYLEGKEAKLYARGGEQDSTKTPEWITKMLRNIIIPVPVPARKFDNLIKRFTLSDVQLRLPENDSADSNPRMSAVVKVVVAVPEDIEIKVDVERVRSNADVLYEGRKLGELDLHKWQRANSSRHGDELWIQSTVINAPLSVTDNKVFAEVVQQMLFGKNGITLGVKAKVDVESATALGQFIIRDVPAEGKISMNPFGGGGFNQDIKSIKVVRSDEDTLVLKTHARVTNPTDYSARIPFANVSLWCNGTHLGDAWGSFDIVPGPNDMKAYASYRKSAVAKEFLSQYLSGQNVSVLVRAHKGSIPGLPGTGLDMNFTVPHVFGRFLNETTMHIFTSTATFVLHSPLAMYITTIAASAFYNGSEIGTIDYDLPFKVIAGSTETPRLPVNWNNNGGYGLIKDALGGHLKLDARANVGIKIGDWVDTVWYEAKGLGAKIRL